MLSDSFSQIGSLLDEFYTGRNARLISYFVIYVASKIKHMQAKHIKFEPSQIIVLSNIVIIVGILLSMGNNGVASRSVFYLHLQEWLFSPICEWQSLLHLLQMTAMHAEAVVFSPSFSSSCPQGFHSFSPLFSVCPF